VIGSVSTILLHSLNFGVVLLAQTFTELSHAHIGMTVPQTSLFI